MKYLIVGLGNPGTEYRDTRHNIGFLLLDALAGASNSSFSPDRYGDVCSIKHKGRQIVLLKPNTYMNLSGKAVRYWIDKEKVALENVLIATDDLALPFGTLRLRKKGSDGGHNGLKNITEVLKTDNFARLRFGIGNEFAKGKQVDYVLGNWDDGEREKLGERMQRVNACLLDFTTIGVDRTMSTYNNT